MNDKDSFGTFHQVNSFVLFFSNLEKSDMITVWYFNSEIIWFNVDPISPLIKEVKFNPIPNRMLLTINITGQTKDTIRPPIRVKPKSPILLVRYARKLNHRLSSWIRCRVLDRSPINTHYYHYQNRKWAPLGNIETVIYWN